LLAALYLSARLSPRIACLFLGHRWAITNRTRAGIYAPVLVCVRCGRDHANARR
jgi:hypothetical protein